MSLTRLVGRGFSAEERFVDVSFAFNDDAIGGETFACLDEEDLAGHEGIDRDEAFACGGEDTEFLWKKAVEKRDGAGGAILGDTLNELAGENERDDGRGRIEVEMRLAAQGLHGAQRVCGKNAEREKGLHADLQVADAESGRPQDGPGAVKDQRRAENQRRMARSGWHWRRSVEVADIEDGAEAHDVGPEKDGDTEAQQQVARFRLRVVVVAGSIRRIRSRACGCGRRCGQGEAIEGGK